jgi:hypothetical protein
VVNEVIIIIEVVELVVPMSCRRESARLAWRRDGSEQVQLTIEDMSMLSCTCAIVLGSVRAGSEGDRGMSAARRARKRTAHKGRL